MIQICENNKCTGCGLCSAVCPKSAITIDIKGLHYTPIINQKQCIDCGICAKKCIANNPIDLFPSKECYAAWSNNQLEHYECASAGVATALSRYFIQNNGYVVGCVWDSNLKATSIITNKLEDLERLKKSKYVHNFFPKNVYEDILKKLQQGSKVLFIGVPCQCAAVKQFVGKYGRHLYVVDLLCRGGCSPKLLDTYVKKLSGKVGEVADITFRGGKFDCNFCLWDKNKKLLYMGRQFSDPYFFTFMRHIAFRPSCYNCQYAHGDRPGDLTLADFWGLDELFIKEHNLNNGVNVVIPHTEKGVDLFKQITPYIESYKRDIQEAILGNDTLKEPTPYPQGYKIMNWAFPILGMKMSLALFDTQYQIIHIKEMLHVIVPKPVKEIIKKLRRK